MIICDTSVWIEYFRNRAPYFGTVCALLERGEVLGLECIFGELLQGVLGKQEREVILRCWEAIHKVSEVGLWLEAGEYAAIHGLSVRGVGLIDAVIACATFKSNSLLWTLDKKLSSVVPGKYRFTP